MTSKRAILRIEGMSCASCARRIEEKLFKLNGVSNASVNFAAGKATVEYNPNVIKQATMEDAITRLGYKVVYERISLKIGGMHCTACAQTIEKALNNIEGVKGAVSRGIDVPDAESFDAIPGCGVRAK
ncbi:MAG: heavy metal translocating P-type ATPase [Actinomycetota bacterium]